MMISLPIIIIMAVLLVLALVTPLFSPFFRKVKIEDSVPTQTGEQEENGSTESVPPVSIVIVEHDSAFRLKQMLPLYLSQQYAADYQVVVVIDENDSESEDVLKLHSSDSHLYYTKLPMTSRYLSRKKLGITLGMRAAKYDWVIVTDVHSYPENDDWLAAVSSHCGLSNSTEEEPVRMVLGLTSYADNAPSFFRFEQLRTMLYCMREAQRGNAFATNQSMVMMRKSDFFQERGFEGNLEFARAEFEFLVNKFAPLGKVALALEPQSWLTQFSPKPSRRMGRMLYVMNAMNALNRTGMYKFLYRLDLNMMHIFNWLTLIVIAIGLVCLYHDSELIPQPEDYPIFDLVFIGCPVLFWLISIVERCIIYRPMLSYFTDINPLAAVMMEWGLSFRKLCLRIRYMFSNKTDFITHKL